MTPLLLTLLSLTIIPPLNLKDPFIQVSINPKYRPSHAPLITGDTFRNFCPFIIDETGLHFEIEKVMPYDAIFVAMPYLDYFLRDILPLLSCPVVLVTSNGDGTIDEAYRYYLDSPSIAAWFGRNLTISHLKGHLIPLGLCWNFGCSDRYYYAFFKERLAKLQEEEYFKEKPIHTYFNMNVPSHPYRAKVLAHFKREPNCKISERAPFKEYIKEISLSRFVISPRGANIDCYRTWEALLSGSIPVVESEGIDALYDDLPVIVVKNLTEVTSEFLDCEFERLKKKKFNLSKLHVSYWLEQIQNAQIH